MPPEGEGYLLLGQPELAEALMRALELKGDLPEFLLPRFSPVVQVLDLAQPEFHYLRRTNWWQGGVRTAAVAAQFSYAFLGRNAVGAVRRNAIAVCEHIVLTNPNAAAGGYLIYLLANGAAPGSGSNSGIPMDDRIASAGVLNAAANYTIGSATSATDFAPGGSVAGPMRVQLTPATTLIVPGPWILTGQVDSAGVNPVQLVVQTNSLNVELNAAFVWRERQLSPTEQ